MGQNEDFKLCRKHIHMDTTETSVFTNLNKECVYCHRSWTRKSYYIKILKLSEEEAHIRAQSFGLRPPIKRMQIVKPIKKPVVVEEKPLLAIVDKDEANAESAEQIRARKAEYQTKYQRDQIDNLKPSYVKSAFAHGTSLKTKDIPDDVVDAYRLLMKLKRELKARKT